MGLDLAPLWSMGSNPGLLISLSAAWNKQNLYPRQVQLETAELGDREKEDETIVPLQPNKLPWKG